jgi:hypothetical protein
VTAGGTLDGPSISNPKAVFVSDPTPTPSETSASSEALESNTDGDAVVATATNDSGEEFVAAVEEFVRSDDDIVFDDVGDNLDALYDATMVSVEDGQLVNGTVVKIDRTRSCSTSATSPRASSRPRAEHPQRRRPVRDRVDRRGDRGPGPHRRRTRKVA